MHATDRRSPARVTGRHDGSERLQANLPGTTYGADRSESSHSGARRTPEWPACSTRHNADRDVDRAGREAPDRRGGQAEMCLGAATARRGEYPYDDHHDSDERKHCAALARAAVSGPAPTPVARARAPASAAGRVWMAVMSMTTSAVAAAVRLLVPVVMATRAVVLVAVLMTLLVTLLRIGFAHDQSP
jgi:hypothetical protein